MDIQGYITLLNRNTGELIDLVRSKDDDTLNHKTFNNWSVLQILEHLLITERYVFELLTGPSGKKADTQELKGSERLNRIMVDMRERKAKAPDMLEPVGEVTDVKQFTNVFLASRKSLTEGLANGKIVVDERIHTHPMLGDMTVSDWLHFLLSHARRHMEQIKDVLRALNKL
jgi:uncharacterized damage-inducible protein DinB